jgi:hypothetical protein
MVSYVKFELKDGTIVYIESTETPKGASGLIPAGRAAEHAAEATAVSFESAVDAVRKMAVALSQNLQAGFVQPPEELSVSFGLKVSGELGALVVSRGGMEANYNVSLRWRRKGEDKDEEAEEKQPAKKGKEAKE